MAPKTKPSEGELYALRQNVGNLIEHGSAEHAAMAGAGQQRDPENEANIKTALDAGVPPSMPPAAAARKQPINRHTYSKGDEIIAGFRRQGD